MTIWVTIKKAADITGYTEKAIERKRATGVWLEGDVWIKAPDGHILISPEGIYKWAEGQVFVPQANGRSKSHSSTRGKNAKNASAASPLPQT
jgi:hypothetical protein